MQGSIVKTKTGNKKLSYSAMNEYKDRSDKRNKPNRKKGRDNKRNFELD